MLVGIYVTVRNSDVSRYDDDDVIGLRDPASFPDAPTCILLASIHTTSSLYSRVVVATENIIREVDKGEDVPARLAQ